MKELIRKVLKEQTEDLEFIDTYWKNINDRLEKIIFKIRNELPQITNADEIKSIGDNLSTIPYSKMGDEWTTDGKSKNLTALSDKITHMIRSGKSDGVKRMLEKIASGRVKSLSQPSRFSDNEFLGKGHFRWNHRAYLLNKKEIDRVKEFFKL